MENVLVKNENILEVSGFILNTAIFEEEDMGFLNLNDYNEGNFDNCKYGTGEEAWDLLFNLIKKKDLYDLEKSLESCKWEDDENTLLIKLKDSTEEFAILRM